MFGFCVPGIGVLGREVARGAADPTVSLGVDLVDAGLVAAAFKLGVEPCIHNVERVLFVYSAFSDGEDVAVVVGAVPNGDLPVPAKAAANAFDTVGDDGLAVARATQHDTAIVLAGRYRLGDRANEIWVVAGFGRVGSIVLDRIALAHEMGDDGLLVSIAGVVGADCDGEFAHGWAVFRLGEYAVQTKKEGRFGRLKDEVYRIALGIVYLLLARGRVAVVRSSPFFWMDEIHDGQSVL